jgi:hypothetical protein
MDMDFPEAKTYGDIKRILVSMKLRACSPAQHDELRAVWDALPVSVHEEVWAQRAESWAAAPVHVLTNLTEEVLGNTYTVKCSWCCFSPAPQPYGPCPFGSCDLN